MDRSPDELRALRRGSGDSKTLIWCFDPKARKGGVWVAFGATAYGAGMAFCDGTWFWHGDDRLTGEAGSVEEAKAEIERLWSALMAGEVTKPMTEKQMIAAYKRSVVGRITSAGPQDTKRVVNAVRILIRQGWLDACPPLYVDWVGNFPEDLLYTLSEAGKLPNHPDIIL